MSSQVYRKIPTICGVRVGHVEFTQSKITKGNIPGVI